MIKILLDKKMFNIINKSNYILIQKKNNIINNNFNYGYCYRHYYCESYEKKLEESKILNELNSSDKEKLNLYNSLKKIELQNEKLIEIIKNLENKMEKYIIELEKK